MNRKIALWALAGLLVACGWAIYASAFPGFERWTAFGRSMWTIAEITCPVAVLGKYVPLKFYWVFAINAATYALLGLGVEFLRRNFVRAAIRRITGLTLRLSLNSVLC